MEIHELGDEFFLVDGRTGRHEETRSRFSQFCEHAKKIEKDGGMRHRCYCKYDEVLNGAGIAEGVMGVKKGKERIETHRGED
jgi:hypothetical protein